jgi:hypothetical protein
LSITEAKCPLLGFDAIGRFSLGQVPEKALTPIILVVDSASYAVTANAVSFNAIDNISSAAYVVAAQGVTLMATIRYSA